MEKVLNDVVRALVARAMESTTDQRKDIWVEEEEKLPEQMVALVKYV
jgi:hypothetical protein